MPNMVNYVDEIFDSHVRMAAKVFTEESMKELVLKKEDAVMKKVIVQMMLTKQIVTEEGEKDKLRRTLEKLEERRTIISAALKQQERNGDEKKRAAKIELEKQKKLMQEKERDFIQRNIAEELNQKEQEERMMEQMQIDKEERRVVKIEIGRQEKLEKEREELRLEMREERAERLQHEEMGRKQKQKLYFINPSNKRFEEQEEKMMEQMQIDKDERRVVKIEIEPQEKLKKEREKLRLEMREEGEERLHHEEMGIKQKQKLNFINPSNKRFEGTPKTQMLEANKLLVEESNARILARIEDIKLERQKNSRAEQNKQMRINNLHTTQGQKSRNPNKKIRIKPKEVKNTKLKVSSQQKLSEQDPPQIDNENRKQVIQMLDLERNAGILDKNYRAIAAKLKKQTHS